MERGLPAAQVTRPSEQDRPLRIHNNYSGMVAFDANAKQPSNTFRCRRHTLETIKRRSDIQVLILEHPSIGYDPTLPIGGSQGCKSHRYPKTGHAHVSYGRERSHSLWLTSGLKLGPRLSE